MRARQANSDEPIWEGRMHLGDEPGIYGDAAYSGLAAELPVTLMPFDPNGTNPPDITFTLTANRVTIFAPYKGHLVSLFAYALVTGSNPPTWTRRQAGQVLMTGETVSISPASVTGERHFSVRLEVATDVAPGLYDDFVLQSLSLRSNTHSADFGFRYI